MRSHAGCGADLLFPLTMRLEVDVAEHDVGDAARRKIGEGLDEDPLVIGPGRARRHQFQPEGVGLRLHDRTRDAVRARALAALVEHGDEDPDIESRRPCPMQGEAAILAAAPGNGRDHESG